MNAFSTRRLNIELAVTCFVTSPDLKQDIHHSIGINNPTLHKKIINHCLVVGLGMTLKLSHDFDY